MTKVLVWLPHSYTGSGPAESCVRIIENFSAAGIDVCLYVNRTRAAVPPSASVAEAAGGVLRNIPYRLIVKAATGRLARLFKQAVDTSPPGTIAYFWPNAPVWLVRYAKLRGLVCVREMINSPLAHARPILDAAYHAAGLAPSHGVTTTMVESETAELALYDFIFSSNAEVDQALRNLGVAEHQILRASFGWSRKRFEQPGNMQADDRGTIFRALFVGLMNVRKGVPVLLEAWAKAGVEGELLLAGNPEQCLLGQISEHCGTGRVRQLGKVADVGGLYRGCDVFVFPTHEEGGPQVTYEAAACGLPIITTPMGAARLIDDGKTGLIVPAGDVEALAAAIRTAARDQEAGRAMSVAAAEQVERFEYAVVGRTRAETLLAAVA